MDYLVMDVCLKNINQNFKIKNFNIIIIQMGLYNYNEKDLLMLYHTGIRNVGLYASLSFNQSTECFIKS